MLPTGFTNAAVDESDDEDVGDGVGAESAESGAEDADKPVEARTSWRSNC